jgi:hypothetical protein
MVWNKVITLLPLFSAIHLEYDIMTVKENQDTSLYGMPTMSGSYFAILLFFSMNQTYTASSY